MRLPAVFLDLVIPLENMELLYDKRVAIKIPKKLTKSRIHSFDMCKKILIMPPTNHCFEFYSLTRTSCFRNINPLMWPKIKILETKFILIFLLRSPKIFALAFHFIDKLNFVSNIFIFGHMSGFIFLKQEVLVSE